MHLKNKYKVQLEIYKIYTRLVVEKNYDDLHEVLLSKIIRSKTIVL